MHNLEIRSLKQEIVYTCDQLVISLSEGNTNHIGCACWNAFLGLVNTSIQTYINHINQKYIEGKLVFIIFIFHLLYIKLFQTLYKYIYIHTVKIYVYVKLYVKIYVNIQIIILNISSSAALYDNEINTKRNKMTDYPSSDDDSDEQKQTKEQKRDELSAEIQKLQEKFEQCVYTPTTCNNLVHPDMTGVLHTRVYNNNFDISHGYISFAISSEDMNVIYDNANLVKRVAPQVQPGNQPTLNYTTAQEKK